jgi:1-deoxy-D-xylulose-5-phosphate reductoisomerase
VLIHPQSLIHSLVEYVDGFYIAQMATPDMGLPIQYAMTYPQRWPTRRERLDLARAGALEFHEPEARRYPCLALAREALGRGGTHPAALNAADEIVVEEFLAGRLPFTGMARALERVMDRWDGGPAPDVETLLAADREARRRALEAAGRERAARCA